MPNTSGETNVPSSEWSPGTLKIYQDDKINSVERIARAECQRLNDLHYADVKRLDDAINDLAKTVKSYIESTQISQDKFEQSTADRFAAVNEFRRSLDDLGKSMQTKSEAAQFQATYTQRHDEVVKAISDLRSRLDVGNPAIGTIQQQLAASGGQRQGSDITIGKIYAAIGAAATVLGILVLLANGVFK